MRSFPAILIGGPPHSGKTVLVYALTQALRDRGVPHYVLRACPDAEGDYTNEAGQMLVRELRHRGKGPFTSEFTERVITHVGSRHMPLLVDVGGKPTEEQLGIFRQCTHAILVIGDQPDKPGSYESSLADWRKKVVGSGLTILAELRSELDGSARVTLDAPNAPLQGVISGLERGSLVTGPVVDAVVQRLVDIIGLSGKDAAALHRLSVPEGVLSVDLPEIGPTIGVANNSWRPEHLSRLAELVPPNEPVAIYGRGPNWLYTFLSLRADAAAVYLFDARYGWMQPPTLPQHTEREPTTSSRQQDGWMSALIPRPDYDLLEMNRTSQYLDPDEPEALPLPEAGQGEGLVLSGSVPYWLLSAAARQLSPHYRWVAVYQPPLNAAVVVAGESPTRSLGSLIALEPGRA